MNLIAKWGLVPKDAMPETACTKSSAEMDAQLERLLRTAPQDILARHAAGASDEELSVPRRMSMARRLPRALPSAWASRPHLRP
jgi:bleomycin hydrolase